MQQAPVSRFGSGQAAQPLVPGLGGLAGSTAPAPAGAYPPGLAPPTGTGTGTGRVLSALEAVKAALKQTANASASGLTAGHPSSLQPASLAAPSPYGASAGLGIGAGMGMGLGGPAQASPLAGAGTTGMGPLGGLAMGSASAGMAGGPSMGPGPGTGMGAGPMGMGMGPQAGPTDGMGGMGMGMGRSLPPQSAIAPRDRHGPQRDRDFHRERDDTGPHARYQVHGYVQPRPLDAIPGGETALASDPAAKIVMDPLGNRVVVDQATYKRLSSRSARTQPCKFFNTRQGCKHGDLCPFYHDPTYVPTSEELSAISRPGARPPQFGGPGPGMMVVPPAGAGPGMGMGMGMGGGPRQPLQLTPVVPPGAAQAGALGGVGYAGGLTAVGGAGGASGAPGAGATATGAWGSAGYQYR